MFAPCVVGAGAAPRALHTLPDHWLGSSDRTSLAQAPGFPIFLVLARLVELPTLLALSLVYAAVCALTASVVGSLLGSRWIAVVLLDLLLFVPPLASDATARLDGHSFAAALTRLTVGCALRLWASPTPTRFALPTGACAAWLGISCQKGGLLVPVLLAVPLCVMGGPARRSDGPRRCGMVLLSAALLLGVD